MVNIYKFKSYGKQYCNKYKRKDKTENSSEYSDLN